MQDAERSTRVVDPRSRVVLKDVADEIKLAGSFA